MSQLPLEIQSALSRLRWGIRRYVFFEGIAVLVVLACLMFWVTFGLDVVYFSFAKLELPAPLRQFALVVMVTVLVGIAFGWILLRLFQSLRRKDLALALERRFPQLNDQLITTVEMEQSATSELQNELISRTRREAASKLASLDLDETFDLKPLKKLGVVAAVLFATLAAFSVANAAGVERWVNAFLLGKADYWDPFRQQALQLKVIAQPGERIREFDSDRIYKHPRGSDLQLLVLNNEKAIPPESVDLQFVAFTPSGTQRGRSTMSRISESQFVQTISQVVDDHHLWIRGGDFINQFPYRIQVVDPPEVNAISLQCDYPSYTGLDGQEDQLVRVVGTQVSLPMETAFELQVECNKPIRFVDIRSDRFEFSASIDDNEGGSDLSKATWRILDERGDVVETIDATSWIDPNLSPERVSFGIPFLVTTQTQDDAQAVDGSIPIPADSNLKIVLKDDDEIYSPEPATLMINGIVDRPPVIDTKRTGVGTLVTRNASLPIEGTLTDDYGLADAWFGYRIGSEQGDNRTPLENEPSGQTEFKLGNATKDAVERFNLRPLKLQEGQSLTVGVYAEDGDELNGPHVAHGELFNFKIVSDDELLARLFDREVNLRLRFEQIRLEVGDLRKELDQQIATAVTYDADPNQENLASTLSVFVERSLHQLRKNHTESRAIEVSFRDLREEMVNNNVHNREKLDRIDNGVLAPLEVLNNDLFDDADQGYALQRLALQRKNNIEQAFTETVPAVDDLLAQMDKILENMRNRGSINDLIQNLRKTIDEQRKLLEETEDKRIQEDFFFDFDE